MKHIAEMTREELIARGRDINKHILDNKMYIDDARRASLDGTCSRNGKAMLLIRENKELNQELDEIFEMLN